MSKYLITGVTGFAGPHLVNLLHSEGHEIHGVIRNSNGREQDIRDVVSDDAFSKIKFH
jgi:nucleoside-diphosphate-sugar epimerase